MEGDWMSTKKIAQSRTRLDRTGYFEEVNVETPAVPGNSDLVDINYNVKERPTGNLSAGIGYSDTQGLLLNLGVSQENFLGTGKRVSINIDNSQVTKNYSFNYTNPYYTPDGISRGFSIYYRQIDALQAQISNYSTNSFGSNISYGFPLSETTSARFTLGYENTELVLGSTLVSQEILDFVNENGNDYKNYPLTASWQQDSRNRRILASEGSLTTLGLEVPLPGSDLEYYKLSFRYLRYFPLWKDTTLSTNLVLGYGDGYGNTNRLPPFKNFFAGGSRSVRGYDSNSLGPRDPATQLPTGGNKRIIANVELILPNPLVEEQGSTRFTVFLDAGNVFGQEQSIDFGELRYSSGVALLWLSPIGALRFSYAFTLNDKPGDNLQAFQFTLGSAF
jgi:outer membrane protein insertion porin family